jgi:hypothetical protein
VNGIYGSLDFLAAEPDDFGFKGLGNGWHVINPF